MIIKQLEITNNGQEIIDCEISDNYFDISTPQPTTEEKLAELKTENATLFSTIDSIISEILPTLMG